MTKATVLLTGGAGYIGSHAVLALRDQGIPTVVLDNLSTGNRSLIPADVPFYQGDAGDVDLVRFLLQKHHCNAAMHFAGSIVVPESVTDPLKYYRNNTAVSRNMIEAVTSAGVEALIFSSTAAVYGNAPTVLVDEHTATAPANPYGTSKLMTEWMLRDVAAATALRYVALRYFNVAGADPAGRTGQCGPTTGHLIRIACEVATGKRPSMSIFGTDYPTDDGTCVRDFIHVSDLASAHVAALRHLLAGGVSQVLNCGYGRGYSVRQVLAAVERNIGHPLAATESDRRPGDPAALVAISDALRHCLDWHPLHDDLDHIVASALAWEKKLSASAHG